MYCGIELEPDEAVPARYDTRHPPVLRTPDEDWECADPVACVSRMNQTNRPPGPERLIITATDAKGQPLL